jgi:hypothetical protein
VSKNRTGVATNTFREGWEESFGAPKEEKVSLSPLEQEKRLRKQEMKIFKRALQISPPSFTCLHKKDQAGTLELEENVLKLLNDLQSYRYERFGG